MIHRSPLGVFWCCLLERSLFGQKGSPLACIGAFCSSIRSIGQNRSGAKNQMVSGEGILWQACALHIPCVRSRLACPMRPLSLLMLWDPKQRIMGCKKIKMIDAKINTFIWISAAMRSMMWNYCDENLRNNALDFYLLMRKYLETTLHWWINDEWINWGKVTDKK